MKFFKRLLLSVALLSFVLTPVDIAAQAASFTIDFSHVTVNQTKQTKFSQDIYNTYDKWRSIIPVLQNKQGRLKKVTLWNHSDYQKISQDSIAEYDPDAQTIDVDANVYLVQEAMSSTLSHELLHSYVPSNLGYGSTYVSSSAAAAYEEMLVSYYSDINFGVSQRYSYSDLQQLSGYGHLLKILPSIQNVFTLAGKNPDAVLQQALFVDDYDYLDKIIGPYLTDTHFAKNLGQYLNIDSGKSNISGAQAYLDEVARKILAKNDNQTIPQIKIYSYSSPETELASFTIPKEATASSWPVYINLSSSPDKETKLTVSQVGALNLNYAGSNDLVFTPDNYSNKVRFIVSYPGGATDGQQAEFRFTGEGLTLKTLRVAYGTAGPGSSDGTTTSESGQTTNSLTGTTGSGTANTYQSVAWSWKDISVLPPCLRTADKAQAAGMECVTESIKYYTNLLLLVIGIASFVYILYGAFLYTTAFGDESKIKQAKKTITYALGGIVLATLAWIIVAVLSSILGVAAPS
jgi:hypothetical protein